MGRGPTSGVAGITRRQVVAFRLARHHLAERVPAADADRAAVVGLQDTPPGTAALALAARANTGPDALDELVIVPSIRGAPMAVAPEDLPVFTAGLEPPDEQAATGPSPATPGSRWATSPRWTRWIASARRLPTACAAGR